MGIITLGKDAKGSPLVEDQYYIHIRTREIIQLFRHECGGFRVEYGAGGRPPNIFNLDVGPCYRPMTREDFEKAIANTSERKSWLESGLAALTKSTEPTEQPDENEGLHLQHHQDTGQPGSQTDYNPRNAAMDGEF